MVYFGEKSSKITVFLADLLPKLTIVGPKCVSWHSNQEWRSICADTVCYLIYDCFIFKLPEGELGFYFN